MRLLLLALALGASAWGQQPGNDATILFSGETSTAVKAFCGEGYTIFLTPPDSALVGMYYCGRKDPEILSIKPAPTAAEIAALKAELAALRKRVAQLEKQAKWSIEPPSTGPGVVPIPTLRACDALGSGIECDNLEPKR